VQKLSEKNNLSIVFPQVAAQWHPTKNGDLTPDKVSFGSSKKVWWKCPVVEDHEWQAVISARTNQGQGCSCCAGKTVVPSNSFAVNHPELAAQWHPIKNDLSPHEVVCKSNKRVWWKCPVANDHEWESSPEERVRGRGCPFCTGNRVCVSNSFATNHPELAAQWHSAKNGDLTPHDLVSKSGVRVWWKCPVADDHEWCASPADRVYGHGCPCCNGKGRGQKVVASNCLETTHPHLLVKWHPIKNTVTPSEVTAGSGVKVWWKCPVADDHEWQATVQHMAQDGGCPCCYGIKVVKSNCLAVTRPDLALQWHATKNGDLTPFDVLGGGRRKVWWKCSAADDHEWEAEIKNRVNGSGCPHCASRGKIAVLSNCLATLKPEVAAQWHPAKNGDLTPYMVLPFSESKVWWKCPIADDHEWEATIANVSSGSGCLCCANRKVVSSNCMAATHPEYVSQWHPTKNADLTPDSITAGSSTKIWWRCEADVSHVWCASPNARFGRPNRITGCPTCGAKRRADKNRWWTTELFIEECKIKHGERYDYSEARYTGFGEKVKIICREHGPFWQRAVTHLKGAGCLACSGILQKTTDEFVKEAKSVHGDAYDYSKTRYRSRTKKVTIICPKHGEFKQRAACHLKGCGCSLCSGVKQLTTEEFVARSRQVHGGKYHYSKVVYTTSDKRVVITCPKHGDFEQQAVSHLQGCDCPKCAFQAGIEKRTLTKDEFVDKAINVHGNKYQYHKANYVNMGTKVVIVCPKHGDFEQCPQNHVHATASCPKCRESKGETKVRMYLENAGITYKYNHRFSTCRNVKPLPFDFVIWHNGKLFLVEYQGKQHYVPVPQWHGDAAQDEFEKVVERDRIKEEWCKQRNIPLLKIPYWKSKDLHNMMDTFLKGT
jgi:hypothetical protein